MAMRYAGRRLLAAVPVLLLVTLVVFLLASLVPGGTLGALLGERPRDAATVAALTAKYRLDQPVPEQYLAWLRAVLRGDLGQSIVTGQPVGTVVADRLGLTVLLNGTAVVLSLAAGVPLGVLAGLRRGGALDRLATGAAMVASSSPSFVVAAGALYLFGFRLGWFPLFGAGTGDILDTATHLTLPACVLALGPLGWIAKVTRAATLDELGQDHVAFARARGLSETRILLSYVLRNVMNPVLSATGVLLIAMLTGSVFVEYVFGLPGLGGLLVSSVRTVDIPVLQGLALVTALWIVFVNLTVDLVYARVDPRVTFRSVGR